MNIALLIDPEIDAVSGGHGDYPHTEAEKNSEKTLAEMTGEDWHCTRQANGEVWCVESSSFRTPGMFLDKRASQEQG